MPAIPVSNSGMPMIGLGTFGKKGNIGIEAMVTALDLGYRHIDTAQDYGGNEREVGEALVRSGLPREQVHITTKIARRNLFSEHLRQSVEASLQTLQVDYVDLLLIHWPNVDGSIPMTSYLDGLAQCQVDGLAKTIGVSNFTASQLEAAVEVLGRGVLAVNQVELHPFLQNRRVRATCERLAMTPVAYMPIAGGAVFESSTLLDIAAQYNASPSQIAISWLLHKGVGAIPSSTSKQHLADNLDAAGINLSTDDLELIDGLDRHQRIINPAAMAPYWDRD
jgi:2,5-diketo-D-gluconate reductase B